MTLAAVATAAAGDGDAREVEVESLVRGERDSCRVQSRFDHRLRA